MVFDSCIASMTGVSVDCFAGSTTGPALRLRQLDAPLNIADRLKILVDLAAVRRAELSAQAPHIIGDGIEHAAISHTCPRSAATAVAE